MLLGIQQTRDIRDYFTTSVTDCVLEFFFFWFSLVCFWFLFFISTEEHIKENEGFPFSFLFLETSLREYLIVFNVFGFSQQEDTQK